MLHYSLMITINNCPVCNSPNIAKKITGKSARRPNENTLWSVWECKECMHGFLNPQLSWDELSSYYSDDYDPYEISHGSAQADDNKIIEIAQREGQFRHIPIPNGKKVLDVGCGGGFFLRICAKLGAKVFGIEPSETGYKATVAQGIKAFHGDIESFIQSSGTTEKFDIITANHVFEHIQNPRKDLENLGKLLMPNGYIWISVPNYKSYFSSHLKQHWHSIDLPYHLHHYSIKSSSLLAESANLKIRKVYTYSLPAATAASLQLLIRKRLFIPQRITQNIPILRDKLSRFLAEKFDNEDLGEAIIIELTKKTS